jgi:hypothetical protein
MNVAVEVDNNPFTSAAHRRDATTDQQALPILLPQPSQALPAHPNGHDAPLN